MGNYQPYNEYKDSGVEWLGEIPKHWSIKRFKFLLSEPFKYGANEPAEISDSTLPRYIRITDVQEDGNLREDTFRSLPEEIAKDYLLEEGDILLARSGATVGKTFIYRKSWGKAAYAGYLIRARTSRLNYSDFMYHFFQSSSYWDWVKSIFIQATIQNISAEKYANLFISIPPLSEQKTIARFLDYKTAQIDALIAKKETLLEKLKEKRAALISQAVTKGLDSSVPMKDSGIEWLGEIPAHWDIKRQRFFMTMQGGSTPDKNNSEFWDGDIPWISAKDMKTERLSSSIDKITEKAFNETSIHLHPQGSIIIVVRGMILAHSFPVAITDIKATINQDLKAIRTTLNPEYLAILLRGIKNLVLSIVEEAAHGTKVLRTDLYKNIMLPVPPLEEQNKIIEQVRKITEKIDKVSSITKQAIATLKEYRTALITNTVTGKIDVRQIPIP
jgi:type I restriction enzyme, S subunit